MTTTTSAAYGVTTVRSAKRIECHAPTKSRINHYSAAPQADGSSDRTKQYARILAFWKSQGIARCTAHRGAVKCPDMGACHMSGTVEVRDILNAQAAGEWFPMAGQGEDTRSDRAVFSHMVPAAQNGAWCPCNIVPEVGAFNHARGEVKAPLTPAARALLAAWPAWWAANAARPASLARLGK